MNTKMKMRMLSLLLCCVMLLSLLPTTALAADTYTVTVNNGTGSGNYAEGASVTVTADAAPEGKTFKEWQIEGLSITASPSNPLTFDMPANNVTLTATYVDEGGLIESASATITVPVAGATPSDCTVVSDEESKYTATVVKWERIVSGVATTLGEDDQFIRGEDYRVYVRFAAKPGYEFDSSANYKINGTTVYAPNPADTSVLRTEFNDVNEIIDNVKIKGVIAPVGGAAPDVSGITSDTEGVNITSAEWKDQWGTDSVVTFEAGEEYKLVIKYSLDSYYKVADGAEVTFNISDNITGIELKTKTPRSITMMYAVPAAPKYTVTVTGGTASPEGPYTVGTEVIVTADSDPEGKKFKEWQIEGLSTTTSESRSILFYMPANNVTITAIYEDANIIIESASATITEPVVGANPDFNIVSADESKYTVTVVKWNLLDGSSYPVLTADDKFVRGESYQLDVKFVANPGYEFSDSCVYNVNGVPRAAYSLTKGERRCYFDVYEIIDTINVKGVVAPVAGAIPDVSGITSDTDGIKVIDVKWRDKDGYAFEGNPFVAGEKYILWLKYETESDYKVADDAEVTFNISDSNILDKEITHPIIKMTYEIPADTTINTINIKGITAPVAGEAPVITGITTDTAGITLTNIQWQNGSSVLNSTNKFEAGQTYNLWIRYAVSEGYEISDDVTVTSDLDNSTYDIDTARRIVHIWYTVPAAPKYTVTVTGGTVDGKDSVTTEAGTRLQLRAPEVSGKRFTGWSGLDGITLYGDNAKVTDHILQFIMPAKNFTVTANYQDAVEITTINIKGITKPLAGANPVNFGVTTDTTGLSVKEVIWYFDRTPSTNVPHDYEFQLGDKLYLLVFLDVADGYTFADPVTITADLEYTAAYRGLTYGTVYLEYTVTEEMPAAKTPVDTVNISGLAKPVVGEMPDNSITVNGTGVTVADDGSYWGRFDSTRFNPYYDDDTAVDSEKFRDDETYMFQLYLYAEDGYEFTDDTEFYFAGKLLPAPDMDDLSKSFAMVNPDNSTVAVVYINMNDIAHEHVAGDWDYNDTHHWRKCTASGCDAGSDLTKLPDYAEHSFVDGICTCGAHQHCWSAEWSVNETHHWHECTAGSCTATDNSGKAGYAAHNFIDGACECGVENVISSIEIGGITAPVVGETPINSASVDKMGAKVDEDGTFWVRYDPSTGRITDTYADGTFVYNTPFREGEIYLLQITIDLESGYSFAANVKILYNGDELPAPNAANPTASCAAIAPDGSLAMALINPSGASVPVTYTVSFDGNGGTGTMTPATGVSGEYELPACTFTAPSGKKFKAWSVGGSEKAVGEKITVTADTTVTAVWENAAVIDPPMGDGNLIQFAIMAICICLVGILSRSFNKKIKS